MTSAPQIRANCAETGESVWMRFFGYLSADALNYLLGFAIYGWLIRILSDRQYGYLSIATSIYQVLMMVAALGLDLIGPRLISDAGGNPIDITQRAQKVRVAASVVICGPIMAVVALLYWHRGQVEVAAVVAAGFAMVLARALDVSYLAVALGTPGPLARTRALGLGLYLVALFACRSVIVQMVWIVPVLNAVGLTMGRFQLFRVLRMRAAGRTTAPGVQIRTSEIAWKGAKASWGQLLLLAYQTLDVVLLAKYVPAQAVGQYAMVSRLYLFGTAVLSCLLCTFMPDLVMVAGDPELLTKRFRKFLIGSTCIGVVGAIAFWLLGPAACESLAHRSLTVAHQVAPMYGLLFLVMAICNPFLSFLPSLHKSGTYVLGIASAGLLLTGLDLLLMPRLGPIGASLAQLVATAFLAVFCAVAYRGYVRGLSLATPHGPARNPLGMAQSCEADALVRSN